MSIELKIKAKHLALEPGIIRHEENKIKGQMKHSQGEEYHQLRNQLERLVNHRKWDVRNEARATHLARVYLKGKPYSSAESKRKEEEIFQQYIVPRIVSMVEKYGTGEQKRISRAIIIEWSKI